MKKIIVILFFFIATNISAQIDPYQIIKDSLGAHRILMTDSTGEYTRVLLRDAISDSIGVGKFVNGTDPLDAVYMDGNVGVGVLNPGEKLEVVGNVEAEEFIGDLRGSVLFKAQAGEALTKGDVVYISGISGNTTIVSKADADDITKMPAFGVSSTDVGLNNPADIYTFGTLSNINTSSFTIGDELYVGTTAGGLVNAAPSGESSQIQKIAKVTRVHASSGSIKVMGAGRTNATPNLNEGRLFVGNSSNKAVADGTIHVDIANSRVGVGTTSPENIFHIKSDQPTYKMTSTNPLGASLGTEKIADIDFEGQKNNLYRTTAKIRAAQDGTWSAATSNFAPTSLHFYTQDNETSDAMESPRMTIKSTGDVGIGTQPTEKLDVDGNVKYSGTLFNGSREEYNNSNIVRVNQIYDGDLVGSYFVAGDYQKILTVTPDGSSEGYHITGNIFVQSGAKVQTLEIDVSLRSQTLPDLQWEISYNNNHTGIDYLKPFLWTKETTTASFILGFEVLVGTIYGSATADLTINCRNSNDKDNIVLNNVAASDQLTVDAGFTEQDFDLKIESAPSVPIISNGQFVGKYPKDSGLDNVVMGSGNATSMTAGQYSIISGKFNVRDATTIAYSNISGINNNDDANSVNYVFANGAYNNQYNSGSSNYNFFNGYLNARDAQGTLYSFLNGRENAEDAVSVNYSFFSGFKNLHTGTGSALYNFFNGRENATIAVDADYSFLAGFRNVYTGAADIDYTFITGLENAYNAASTMVSTNIMGSRNAYTTTGNLNYFTSIGYENGKLPTVSLNNTILLGFRQGYSVGSEGAAAYRLAIGMYQDNPLIYGEFDNALVKINGELEVTGSIETDGDLGALGELNITGDAIFSESVTVENRTGNANKSAFFDTSGKLVEGDLVSAYVGYGGIKSVFKTISSTAATLLNLQNTFGSTNTVLGTAGGLGKITVDSSGYWQVIVSGGISDYTVEEKLELEIWVNGVSTAVYNFWKPEDSFAINVTHVLDLQSDDYVQLKLDSVTDNDYNYSGVKLVLTRLANN